jgi:carboxynorspermidine decarboxylase
MHPQRPYLSNFDPTSVPSPCFVVDQEALERNAKILKHVADQSGAKVLLALKSYAYSDSFKLLKPYLSGVCASSPHEARLGFEKFGKEVHGYAPAFSEKDLIEFFKYSDHLVFNSLSQWQHHKDMIQQHAPNLSVGLRINPEYSEAEVELYDPCAKGSRLGTPKRGIDTKLIQEFDGLHFHCLCEQGADVLQRTLEVVEKDFGEHLSSMNWLNFGGGHHITQPDYDVDLLIKLLQTFRDKYDLQIYIEPGEAIGIHTGALVTTVLDITNYGDPIAILDISATCHMPDILEMPYRPNISNSGLPDEKAHSYNLGGLSCLAGDIIGRYSFDQPLKIGDRLVFEDMSHYTMVKTTNFNGIQLPSIGLWNPSTRQFELTKSFDYSSYASRIS